MDKKVTLSQYRILRNKCPICNRNVQKASLDVLTYKSDNFNVNVGTRNLFRLIAVLLYI